VSATGSNRAPDTIRRPSLGGRLLWTVLLVLVTMAMAQMRPDIDQAHVVLAYLLVVLGASVGGGRGFGFIVACASFLCINYFFQEPYDTLAVSKPLELVVLFAFLATSVTATELLARAQAEAAEASRRADEVTRLSHLGSETLNAGTPERALEAIARVIRDELRVDSCAIDRVADAEQVEVAHAGAWPPDTAGRTLVMPLAAHGVAVGRLRLYHATDIVLGRSQDEFLEALTYYAALGVERMRLESEAAHAEGLREANRLKDILLATVSHDLRTPLTTIKALAEDGALRGDENSVIIEEQADRLARLVSDLLDLSRIKGGTFRTNAELNSAEDVIGAVVRQFAGTSRGRRLATALDLSQPALFGTFDFVHTLRILSNLVENALRYSPPGAPVDLSASRQGDRLRFAVADRGPGVPPSQVGQIFEPFYRPPAAANDGGAGLGLSIAQRLAQAQGGTVQYAPRVGGGSVFSLVLPAFDPD
jgi:two-component system, OmpR family, sensor histidine kinase KdpD